MFRPNAYTREIRYFWFSLFYFYCISTLVDYLWPNPLYINIDRYTICEQIFYR